MIRTVYGRKWRRYKGGKNGRSRTFIKFETRVCCAFEEQVLGTYEVAQSKRKPYRGRGEPFRWEVKDVKQKTHIERWRQILLSKSALCGEGISPHEKGVRAAMLEKKLQLK